MDVSGRNVVVTGAAYGIGRGLATAFLNRGANVALVDIDEEGAGATAKALSAQGRVMALTADVREADDMDRVAAAVTSEFGSADIVCANAGVGPRERPLWEIPRVDWDWVFGVNVMGVVNTIRSFVPAMVERDTGHIVITASMQGITTGRVGPYAASKHAAASIAECLYGDLRRQGKHVGVSCLCPSYTKNSLVTNPDRLRWHPDGTELTDTEREKLEAVRRKLAANGLEPEKVGEMVVNAVEHGTFWIIPTPESLSRVTRRTEEIVKGLLPSIANT